MSGELKMNTGDDGVISSDDLCEYAVEWAEAVQTKLWAEEQLKALIPPGSELHVGAYVIRRGLDSVQVLPSA